MVKPSRGDIVSTEYSGNQLIKKNKALAATRTLHKGVNVMKGYYTSYGYMGLVNGRYRLFATESEYIDYMTT